MFIGSALMLLGAGCTERLYERAAEKAIENKINSESGRDASVDINNGQLEFSDEETGATGSFGADIKVPDDFPGDIVLPDGITVMGVTNTPEAAWISYTSQMTVVELGDWYKSELEGSGWTKQGEYLISGANTYSFRKDSVTLSVVIAESTSADDTRTVIVTRVSD